MNTLRRLSPEVLELDSDTPHEQAWLGGGCLLLLLGAIVGLAGLGEALDDGPARWLFMGSLATMGLGLGVTLLGFQLQESYLLGSGGITLRRRWLGRTRERLLARSDQIHCLALDVSDRLPRRWRLMLVGCDGQTRELAGYSLKESEDERWNEICALGSEVAAALGAPLRLPEGVERERQLEVSPGSPPAVHYAEHLQATDREVNELAGLAFVILVFVGVLVGLHFLGVI